MCRLPRMHFVDFWLISAIPQDSVRLVSRAPHGLDRRIRQRRGFDLLKHDTGTGRGQIDAGRLDAGHGRKRLLHAHDARRASHAVNGQIEAFRGGRSGL